MSKTKATGGNEPPPFKPKTTVRGLLNAKRAAQVPSYTYDHKTGLYTMNARALTEWLMDVQGRAKLEAALSKACDMIEAMVPDMPGPSPTAEFRKLVPKKEK